ncbi:MAG: hypothetical protein M1267_01325 [Candidatus Thermoplasmatota archaeon]|jgi:ABC-type Na+ efflux pump permease subunit|nr:hypothetical protein [Candidatus Thermoplasmatota archaeon]MCL5800916.1 hypothetical protein [Candidatus Thermoplasmatota archaeon]
MARNTKLEVSRILVAISLLLLFIALIFSVLAIFSIGGNPLSSLNSFGGFVINETVKVVALLLILLFLLFAYAAVFVRLRRLSSRPRDAALVIGLLAVIIGYFFLGDWVLLGGVFMLAAWVVLIA